MITRWLSPDFWFYVAAGAIVALVGLIVYASAADVYRTDAFVRMIERHISASTHVEITPGIEVTNPECQCTVRYDGTRIDGHHYSVEFDKLD